jgi:hypothetical protein
VDGNGTVYATDVPNAGEISWLLTNIAPTATTADEQAALQAAIWRTEYGDGFELDGVDNNNYAPDNSTIAPIYQADLFAANGNTAPTDDEFWITTGPNPDTSAGQGLVAMAVASATNTTVTSSPNPSYVGQSVKFTATVANAGADSAGTPTGSVQFQIDGSNYRAPVALANGTASVSDAALAVGTHAVQAMYTPDTSDFTASTSDTYNQTVVAQVTLGNLSPTEWPLREGGYDGTIPVSGGTGGYRNLRITGLPKGLTASVVSETVNGQQSGTIMIKGTPEQAGPFTLITTVQDGNGQTGHGKEYLTITLQSAIWAGYLATTNLDSPRAGSVTSVSGSWVVPKVSGPPTASVDVWVGIDGYTDSTVEQVGTTGYIDSSGKSMYYAWYEVAGVGKEQQFKHLTIKPGDRITAAVIYNPASNSFTMTIHDLTTKQPPGTAVVAGSRIVQRETAEWIVEDTGSGVPYHPYPLADFGAVTFSNASATINGKSGPISYPSWQNYRINMISEDVFQPLEAAPSTLTPDGRGFTVKYVP